MDKLTLEILTIEKPTTDTLTMDNYYGEMTMDFLIMDRSFVRMILELTRYYFWSFFHGHIIQLLLIVDIFNLIYL